MRKVCGRGRRSGFRPLSPEWFRLRELIAEEPIRWKLSRFMAFCSSAGIVPAEVDDGVMERFRVAVQDSREVDMGRILVSQSLIVRKSIRRTEWPSKFFRQHVAK